MATQDIAMSRVRFRHALRQRAGAAAVPYGYTALTAATFGVLIETHGPPTSVAAALFLGGAILGFALAALPGTRDEAGAYDADPGPAGVASSVAAAAAFSV